MDSDVYIVCTRPTGNGILVVSEVGYLASEIIEYILQAYLHHVLLYFVYIFIRWSVFVRDVLQKIRGCSSLLESFIVPSSPFIFQISHKISEYCMYNRIVAFCWYFGWYAVSATTIPNSARDPAVWGWIKVTQIKMYTNKQTCGFPVKKKNGQQNK